MAIFSKITPLDHQISIVDPATGKPSSQFIRLWQQLFGNTEASQEGLDGKADKTITITAGAGLTGGGNLSANRVIALEPSGVTPGAYTNTDLTVDEFGRITLAANGSGGGGGGGQPWYFDPPPAADFTFLASGDATNVTLTDDTDVGTIIDGGLFNVGGDRQRTITKNITSPASAWEVTARIAPTFLVPGAGGIFLCLLESSTNKAVHFGQFASGTGAYEWQVWRSTSGSLVGYTAEVIGRFVTSDYVFCRVTFDGSSTYTFSASLDGKTFSTLGTMSATTAFTVRADRVGFCANSNSGGGRRILGVCDSWQQSW